ncbi:NADP-dependent oxidoreductase [Candidatus Curtissbacteria bacterium]|nr:NADP-dependent oxidoreductase [Candidatus Curtissbacteria bacterium]
MKAIQINKYGGIEVLELNQNAPEPDPSEKQVLVEVYAASINPIDWKLREGYLKQMVPLSFPATLGGDFSGVVNKVGKSVTNFKIGDQIYGQAGILNGGSGSFAQFATANIDKVSQKPKNIDFVQASALPLAGVSALQALEDHIHLKKGQKILIHGGAGGIGTFAIQIAKSLGAYVTTTVSSDDLNFVKSLGADQAIDYKNEAFEQLVKNIDCVFDTVGGKITDRSFAVLKKGGIIVSMVGQPNQDLAQEFGTAAIGQGTDANPERLNRLTKLAESEKIKAQIDKVFSLTQAKEAFRHLEEGHPRGKVVLKIK